MARSNSDVGPSRHELQTMQTPSPSSTQSETEEASSSDGSCNVNGVPVDLIWPDVEQDLKWEEPELRKRDTTTTKEESASPMESGDLPYLRGSWPDFTGEQSTMKTLPPSTPLKRTRVLTAHGVTKTPSGTFQLITESRSFGPNRNGYSIDSPIKVTGKYSSLWIQKGTRARHGSQCTYASTTPAYVYQVVCDQRKIFSLSSISEQVTIQLRSEPYLSTSQEVLGQLITGQNGSLPSRISKTDTLTTNGIPTRKLSSNLQRSWLHLTSTRPGTFSQEIGSTVWTCCGSCGSVVAWRMTSMSGEGPSAKKRKEETSTQDDGQA